MAVLKNPNGFCLLQQKVCSHSGLFLVRLFNVLLLGFVFVFVFIVWFFGVFLCVCVCVCLFVCLLLLLFVFNLQQYWNNGYNSRPE